MGSSYFALCFSSILGLISYTPLAPVVNAFSFQINMKKDGGLSLTNEAFPSLSHKGEPPIFLIFNLMGGGGSKLALPSVSALKTFPKRQNRCFSFSVLGGLDKKKWGRSF
jgi:hypothetical protein